VRTKVFIVVAILLITSVALAVPLRVERRDMKLATQQLVEKQTFTDPSVAGTNQILNAHAGATSAATVTVTTFAGQPDIPRNLIITPGGTTNDVEACTITVNGTNIFNRAISEDFAFEENASTATTGSKAFKTVTSVVFPADCESGGFAATWSIGRGEKLGLQRCMASPGHLVFSTVAGAYETTRATVTADVDEIEKNTVDFNGTMNGSNDFEAFYFQNFRCFP
jgi:hypothetical protein